MITKTIIKVKVILLSIAMLLLTSSCSYNTLNLKSREKIETLSMKVLQLAASDISLSAEKIEKYLYDISLDQTVQESLNTLSNDEDEFQKMDASRQITNILTEKLFEESQIAYAGVVNDSGYSMEYRLSMDVLSDKDSMREHIKAVKDKKGSIQWLPVVTDAANYILAGKSIRHISSGKELGTFLILLKESYFADIYKSIGYGENSSIFIMDSAGIVISTTDEGLKTAKEYAGKKITDKIVNSELQDKQGMFSINIDQIDKLVAFYYIPSMDWYIVGIISK